MAVSVRLDVSTCDGDCNSGVRACMCGWLRGRVRVRVCQFFTPTGHSCTVPSGRTTSAGSTLWPGKQRIHKRCPQHMTYSGYLHVRTIGILCNQNHASWQKPVYTVYHQFHSTRTVSWQTINDTACIIQLKLQYMYLNITQYSTAGQFRLAVQSTNHVWHLCHRCSQPANTY